MKEPTFLSNVTFNYLVDSDSVRDYQEKYPQRMVIEYDEDRNKIIIREQQNLGDTEAKCRYHDLMYFMRREATKANIVLVEGNFEFVSLAQFTKRYLADKAKRESQDRAP